MSTLASLKGGFFATVGRYPTQQEIFDRAVAEGRRREREQQGLTLHPGTIRLRLQIYLDAFRLAIDRVEDDFEYMRRGPQDYTPRR